MILDKNQLKYITQAITPEQSTYVAQVSNILNNASETPPYLYAESQAEEASVIENIFADDLLYLNKLQAFSIKFKDLEWVVNSEALKSQITSLYYMLTDYINQLIPLFRSAYDYQDTIFANLTIPVESEPLTLIDSLKETVFNFVNKQYTSSVDTAERTSMKDISQRMLTEICRYVYEYRLARSGAEYNKSMVSC